MILMSELMILCSLRHVLEICLLLNMLTIVLLHTTTSSSSSSSSGQNFGALLLYCQIDRCHEKSSPPRSQVRLGPRVIPLAQRTFNGYYF